MLTQTMQQHLFVYKRAVFIRKALHVTSCNSWPDELKTAMSCGSVMQVFTSTFHGPLPEYDQIRSIVAFNDGQVYDFATGTVTMGTPRMLCKQHLPYPYTAWGLDLQQQWQEIVDDIIEFWRSGNPNMQEAFDTNDVPLSDGTN